MFPGKKSQVNYLHASCPHATLLDSVSCGQMRRPQTHNKENAEATLHVSEETSFIRADVQ